jgi:carboxypeptidase family protein
MRANVSSRLFLSVAVVAFLVLVISRAAFAQTGTATINGQVTDESGAVLPGVTVTATSPALQVPQVVSATDQEGRYRLTPLPIGTYNVTFELAGFKTVRREEIRLTVGFTARVDAAMSVGALAETITVSGASPLVDTASTANSTQLTRETLELLPTSRSSYSAILMQTPSARMPANRVDVGGSQFANSPRFYALGQLGDSWHSIENIIAMSPADNPSGNYIDYSAMDETVVSIGGHSADTPNMGLQLNAIVKTGGNDFTGSAYYAYTGHSLQSDNIGRYTNIIAPERLQYRDDTNLELGGRILTNKLWFFGSFRQRRQIDEIVAVCKKPDGSQCDQNNHDRFFTIKVTNQVNAKNRIIGFVQPHYRNRTGGGSATADWSTATARVGFEGTWKGEWQYVPTNRLVLSVLGGAWWLRSGDEDPGITKAPAGNDSFLGTSFGSSTAIGGRNPQDRYQVRASAEWYKPDFAGTHRLKVGTDFFKMRAERGSVSRGELGNYTLTFLNRAADRITVFSNPVTPKQPMMFLYWYGQDSWAMGSRVTLNLGANIHRQAATINPDGFCRKAADGPAAIIFPSQCYPEDAPPVYKAISPRAHLSYDVTGRSTTVIKGGYARYYTPLLEDDLHIANHYTISDATYRWRDLNGNRDYDSGEVDLDPNHSDFLSINLRGGDPLYGFGHFNPDLQQRYHDEVMLSFERQLASTWAARVSGIQSWAKNQWRVKNVLRPYSAYNIPITNPDPGNDGIVGNADDPVGRTFTYYDYPAQFAGFANQDSEYINDESADRSYKSFEGEVNRRYGNNWQFRTSYSATWKTEPFGTSDNTVIVGLDPNSEINSGYNNLLEWEYRAAASYLFRYGILGSANYDIRSGEYWERSVQFRGPAGSRIPTQVLRVEPRGSRQVDSLKMLDIRAEKRFELGGTRRLSVTLNVYNLLNANSPLGIQGRSGPQFGFVTSIPPGRLVEGAFRLGF